MSIQTHVFRFGVLTAVIMLMGASCISVGGEEETPTTGAAGVFVSTDKAENWQAISSAPTASGVVDVSGVSVYRLASDPQDPSALYWASRSEGLLFSYDKGKTWQKAAAPLNAGFIYAVAVHPIDKCTIYATTGRILYKTTDCSRSWQEVYTEAKQNVVLTSIAIHHASPYEVLLTEDNGTVLKSIDGGKSWQVAERFKDKGLRQIVNDPFQEGVFYVAFDTKGLYKSVDTGETWESLEAPLKKFSGGTKFRRMSFHPFVIDKLYWISDYGILVSEDGGITWESMSLITSPGSAKIYGFVINPKNEDEMYYTATIQNRSTLYKTIDGGRTWTTKRLPSGQIPTALHMDTLNELLYVGFTIPPGQ